MKMSAINNARALVTLLDARDRLASYASRRSLVLSPDDLPDVEEAIEIMDDTILELVRAIQAEWASEAAVSKKD